MIKTLIEYMWWLNDDVTDMWMTEMGRDDVFIWFCISLTTGAVLGINLV